MGTSTANPNSPNLYPGTDARGYNPSGPGPGIHIVSNVDPNRPQGNPSDFYNAQLNDPWWQYHTNSPSGRMGVNYQNPLFWNDQPGQETKAWISSIMQDPYAIPEASKRAALEGVERSYGTAAGRVRNDTLGSGAAGGGVARGVRGNVETARAAGMSDAIRNFEQQKQAIGDERLKSLGLGWVDRALQSEQTGYNAMLGQQNLQRQNNNSSGMEDLLGAALQAYMAYQTYGGSRAAQR